MSPSAEYKMGYLDAINGDEPRENETKMYFKGYEKGGFSYLLEHKPKPSIKLDELHSKIELENMLIQ